MTEESPKSPIDYRIVIVVIAALAIYFTFRVMELVKHGF